MLTRRRFLQQGSIAAAAATLVPAQIPADYKLEIASHTLDLSPKHSLKTIAYNNQVPGPILRLKEGKPVTIEVTNRTADPEVVHWHGLFLPPEVDGAMEEGTPMIAPGATARYTYTPTPSGFRWYHTHTMAGDDLKKSQYTGQHGFLWIAPKDPKDAPPAHDQEFFLALHDWEGELAGSGDGSMNPTYKFSTINGRMLDPEARFPEPLRVEQGQRVLFHILNSSPTEPHWIALSGHKFRVLALDGNPVPTQQSVPMLRLSPAERVTAIVEMNNPGSWIMGEVRKHIQSAGMGIVIEYANSTGTPQWQQPDNLLWNYQQFGAKPTSVSGPTEAIEIPLVFESRFAGHGAQDHWRINGKSWPHTEASPLTRGQRYRLKFINKSPDDHPVHLHRHSFELRLLRDSKGAAIPTSGILKDVVLVPAGGEVHAEFTANQPGPTLFHCHQQNHMDEGFMLLFHYA